MGKRPRKRKRARPRKESEARGARRQLAVLTSLSQGAAAWLLGISARTLRDSIDAPRLETKSGRPRYNAQALTAWWLARELAARGAGQSQSLEDLRKVRARAAAREEAVKEGKLLDKGDVDQVNRSIAIALRTQLEAIGRVHGPEVAREIGEALSRAEAQLMGTAPGAPAA